MEGSCCTGSERAVGGRFERFCNVGVLEVSTSILSFIDSLV